MGRVRDAGDLPVSDARKSNIRSVWLGARDSLGPPTLGIFAALSGYAVMAREAGLDLTATIVSVATIWTMPALMAYTELLVTGAAVWAFFVALLVISVRNLPMALSAIPIIRRKPGFRWHHLMMAQLLSPTAWVQVTTVGRTIEPADRAPYYLGFASTLLLAGLLGTWIGYTWAARLHPALGVSLLLFTPLYIIFTMMTSRKRSSLLALLAGCMLVPPLMLYNAEFGLIAGGVTAGTIGFLLGRREPPEDSGR